MDILGRVSVILFMYGTLLIFAGISTMIINSSSDKIDIPSVVYIVPFAIGPVLTFSAIGIWIYEGVQWKRSVKVQGQGQRK